MHEHKGGIALIAGCGIIGMLLASSPVAENIVTDMGK
jgi:threonine dehydrogenase-like Zn-dependent dehydrogenase